MMGHPDHKDRWADELLHGYKRWKRAELHKRLAWLFAFGSLCTAAGALLVYAL